MCSFIILAFHSPYDETDNYNSNNKDKNDDAEGFSGFALQMQKNKKHVYRCSGASRWQVKIIWFISRVKSMVFSRPQIWGYIFLLFNTYSSMLSKYILELTVLIQGVIIQLLLMLFLDVWLGKIQRNKN